jgi:hypothetical protein
MLRRFWQARDQMKGRTSFLKKRTKKLLLIAAGERLNTAGSPLP